MNTQQNKNTQQSEKQEIGVNVSNFWLGIAQTIINIIIENFSTIKSKIKEWWVNSKLCRFLNRYLIFKNVKANQKVFTSYILLNTNNTDETKTKHQKQMYSIQHKLDRAVVNEMEIWVVIKSRMTSPKENEVMTELLSIDNIKICDCLLKSNIKYIAKKRLKCCKQYNKWCNKYAKNQIDNYQIKKLDCFNGFVKATQTYYKLLYLYLPLEKRTVLEKSLK